MRHKAAQKYKISGDLVRADGLIVLDENILDGQRLLLEASRIAARQTGVDVGCKGMKDEEIVVLSRRQRNIAFFTLVVLSSGEAGSRIRVSPSGNALRCPRDGPA